MISAITISVEIQNHGDWIKIFMPYETTEKMFAQLQNDNGDTIKKVSLIQGNNAIDISSVKNQCINLKIETQFETILKKIKLS
jgi:hypothetical protein